MRKLMRGMGSKKEAGRSWIEVRDQVYSFVVGEKMGSHKVGVWSFGFVDLAYERGRICTRFRLLNT